MSADVWFAVFPGLFYPDIYDRQGAIDLSGIHVVCIKRTKGTYYRNPVYAAQVAQAEAAGAFHFAYWRTKRQAPSCRKQPRGHASSTTTREGVPGHA